MTWHSLWQECLKERMCNRQRKAAKILLNPRGVKLQPTPWRAGGDAGGESITASTTHGSSEPYLQPGFGAEMFLVPSFQHGPECSARRRDAASPVMHAQASFVAGGRADVISCLKAHRLPSLSFPLHQG